MSENNKMHRRCLGHDYRGRRFYMLTMTVEGRLPLLGSLVTGESGASVSLTPLGEAVERAWLGLPGYYPQLKMIAHQVMPDHLHGIVFVERELPRHLGQVVAGYKYGTTRAMHELQQAAITSEGAGTAEPCRTQPAAPQPAGVPQPARTAGVAASAQPAGTTPQAGEVEWASVSPRPWPRLWSEGYHDMIVWREGQLQRMIDYVHDNPRRLAMKRAHRDLFTVRRKLTVAAREMDGLGNLFLLEWPLIVQVRCSRSLTAEAIEREVTRMMRLTEKGAVLVSPAISPGEKAVMRAAIEAGHRVILLLENGFGDFAKPGGKLFDACAEGRLLMLAPWGYHTDKRTIKRWQCNDLNAMAHDIATVHL